MRCIRKDQHFVRTRCPRQPNPFVIDQITKCCMFHIYAFIKYHNATPFPHYDRFVQSIFTRSINTRRKSHSDDFQSISCVGKSATRTLSPLAAWTLCKVLIKTMHQLLKLTHMFSTCCHQMSDRGGG